MARNCQLPRIPESNQCKEANLHETIGVRWTQTYFIAGQSRTIIECKGTLVVKDAIRAEYQGQIINSEPNSKAEVKNRRTVLDHSHKKANDLKQPVNLQNVAGY